MKAIVILSLCLTASTSSAKLIASSLQGPLKNGANVKKSIPAQTNNKQYHKRLSIAIPWLYFMAVNINLPNLPTFINSVVNGANTVSGESQKVYGALSGFDALFTFLSVNAVGCLSDVYGRKPFMIYSALGLSAAYMITSTATTKTKWIFYAAGALDGLTSCMFSQSQAYISDVSKRNDENLSISLSQFQGIAIGLAFMLGIPLGGSLGRWLPPKAILWVASGFCLTCALAVYTLLPESLEKQKHFNDLNIVSSMNPLGAVHLFLRSKSLTVLAIVYGLINFAQAGLQIVWINYLKYKFGWPPHISALSLAIVGFSVALLPRLYIPILGTKASIKYGLLIHASSLVLISLIRRQEFIFCIMPFFAIGSSTLPTLLGYMAEQCGPEEVGAIQGAAETVRMLVLMISFQTTSNVFSHLISQGRQFPQGVFLFSSIYSFLAFAIFSLLIK